MSTSFQSVNIFPCLDIFPLRKPVMLGIQERLHNEALSVPLFIFSVSSGLSPLTPNHYRRVFRLGCPTTCNGRETFSPEHAEDGGGGGAVTVSLSEVRKNSVVTICGSKTPRLNTAITISTIVHDPDAIPSTP
jgi:hypothetical protein